MLKRGLAVAAGASLVVCLWASAAYFRGSLEEASFHLVFGLASLAWFVLATVYASRR